MVNLIPMKEYHRVKNEKITIVCFRDGERILTHSGASYVDAIERMTMHGRHPGMASDTYMIVHNDTPSDLTTIRNEAEFKDSYQHYCKCQETILNSEGRVGDYRLSSLGGV